MANAPSTDHSRRHHHRRLPWSRLLRLFHKELKETTRDRRTIVTLVLMPLLVYPVLSMALNRFLLTSPATGLGYTVGMASVEEEAQLSEWLADPRSAPPAAVLASSGDRLATFVGTTVTSGAAKDAVARNEVDVGVKIEGLGSPTPIATIYAYRGDGTSQAARRVLVERLHWLLLVDAQFELADADADYAPPVEIVTDDIGEAAKGDMLATIVPLVLVLMTITGAVYPSIDLTAGERERGTMESVMASPVPRGYVLIAKYFAVVIVALFTALANLLAMFTTLWASGLLATLTGDAVIPWITILRILGLLVLFSGFFSAVLLSLTSFARSFKEAQAYLIPVMLLSLAPGMLSLMPGANLSGALAIVPLVNIVLLARDLLSGSVEPSGALAAVVSTMAYAAAALSVATKLFGSDAVTRTSEKSIGSLLHRPRRFSTHPSTAAASLMLALLVPIYFVVSNGLMKFLQHFQESVSIDSQLLLNASAQIITFGCVPLLAAFLGRNRLRTTYRIRHVHPACYIGACLLGLGSWAFAHEAFVLAESFGIGGLSEERLESAQGTIEKMRQASPWLLLAVFALTPAIIEELCFRGYLFSALEDMSTPRRTILITAAIFGLFHVLTGNTLLIERFVPSTLMGLIIGWVAYRSGSVLPGIAIHFVHNGLLNLALYYTDQLKFLGEGFDNQMHLPPRWLLAASLIVTVGALLVWGSTRRSSSR